jgi:endonuclease/exonuclease/phosphatase (EEP) superfamily protein YafD
VTSHRAPAEQNPWLLAGAFVVVAALVFVLVRLAGPDGGDSAADVSAVGTASTSAEPAPSADQSSGTDPLAVDAEAAEAAARNAARIQPGQVIRPKKRGRLAPPSDGGSGTGIGFGVLPTLDLPKGAPVKGTVTTAVANLPNRTSAGGFASSLRTLTAGDTDFVVLNEVSGRGTDTMAAAAPGYDAYRDPQRDGTLGGTQSMNNVVMWDAEQWRMIDGGRVKVVDDDRGFHGGRPFTWDRYATWAALQREDGAIVSVVSTHMMTNPGRFPRQHGNAPGTRVQRYARGMDVLRQLAGVLSAHGPVLVAGDMNSHASQGAWTAAAKMRASGYAHVKDRGVMYLFYPGGVEVASHRQVGVASDHPAIVTTLDMNGTGPS